MMDVFNLQTFPVWDSKKYIEVYSKWTRKEKLKEALYAYQVEVREWKEGFEKQLRLLEKDGARAGITTIDDNLDVYVKIKKILGVDSLQKKEV